MTSTRKTAYVYLSAVHCPACGAEMAQSPPAITGTVYKQVCRNTDCDAVWAVHVQMHRNGTATVNFTDN